MNTIELDERGVIEICPQCGQKNRVLFSRLSSPFRCGRCKTELPQPSSVIVLGEETLFDSLIAFASLPVLVDFWAEWCGPCKMMAPEIERAAASSPGKILAAKVNTDELPGLAQKFRIAALPTLILFSGGAQLARAEGARSAGEIQRFVEQGLRRAASAAGSRF